MSEELANSAGIDNKLYQGIITDRLAAFLEQNSRDEHTENPNISPEAQEALFSQTSVFVERVIQEGFSEQDTMRVMAALELTLEAHTGQKPRPDGKQYSLHPIGVATSVMELLNKPDASVVVAALLHDTVEDQAKILANKNKSPISDGQSDRERALDFISATFGEQVADAVKALSNPEPAAELDNLSPEDRQARKNEIYKDHVVEIASHSTDVLLIKLFDFNDNALRLNDITAGKDSTELEKAHARRAKLSKKYMPVIDVFITKLQDPAVVEMLKPDELTTLQAKLSVAKEDIAQYLDSRI